MCRARDWGEKLAMAAPPGWEAPDGVRAISSVVSAVAAGWGDLPLRGGSNELEGCAFLLLLGLEDWLIPVSSGMRPCIRSDTILALVLAPKHASYIGD